MKINRLQEEFQEVPEDLKLEFEDHLAQGFPEWTSREYHLFIKSFRRRPLNDYEGISSEVKTKTADEVKEYMEVFLKRFREIKERDLVIKKFSQKDFDQKNLETILKYDQYKNYAIFL